MFRKTMTNLAVTAAMLLLASPGYLAAQAKFAVVDFQRALLETGEMQKEAGALEQKFKPRQDEIETLSRELQDIQQKLQTAGPAEGQQLQQEGQRKQRDAQRITEDLQSDVEFERNRILEMGARKMRDVVAKLAEEGGYDLVVDVSNTLYFKSALDITKNATSGYDAAHPVAK